MRCSDLFLFLFLLCLYSLIPFGTATTTSSNQVPLTPPLDSPSSPPPPSQAEAAPPAAYTEPSRQRQRRSSLRVAGGDVGDLPSSIRGFRFNAPLVKAGTRAGVTASSTSSHEGRGDEEQSRPTGTLAEEEDGGTHSSSTPSSSSSSSANSQYVGEPPVEELALSPIVLVVTVDGNVHALQRETGRWVWTLHDDGGAESPNGNEGDSDSDKERRARVGEALGGPLVRGRGRKAERREKERERNWRAGVSTRNESGLVTGSKSLEEGIREDEEEDEVYVIEPHSQGDIYLYTRGKNLKKDAGGNDESTSGSGGVLQKLPLSMQQLVALSPFTFPTDSSRMFVGRKETKLVGVDLRTGRLVGVFGSGSGWCEWDEAKEGRVRTEEECEEEISRRPEDLLYMARTGEFPILGDDSSLVKLTFRPTQPEYHLSIYSKSSSSLLQTLTYSTYTSSSPGSTLQSQWTQTPDSRYLQPMHDGSLICFLSGVAGLQWTIAFEVPVVSVFDIAIPPSDPSNKGERAQPLMFEQPHPLPVDGLPLAFDELSKLPDATFIGSIDGEPFAMSRDNFPLVAFAPPNKVEKKGAVDSVGSGEEVEKPKCRGIDCLVGRHDLPASPTPSPIDPPSKRLGIEGPPILESLPASPSSPRDPLADPNRSSPPPPGRSSVLASIYQPVFENLSTSTSSAGLLLLIVAIASYFYTRKGTGNKKNVGKESAPTTTKRTELHSKGHSVDYNAIEYPPTPPPRNETISTVIPPFSLDRLPLSPPPERDLLPPSATTLATTAYSPPLYDHKALPPLPPPELEEDGEGEGDSDGEFKDPIGGEVPKKKGRRRRGKKTKKVKIDEITPVGQLDEGEGLDKELSAITLSAAEVKEEETGREGSDPHLIGGLSVSETVLGYGSHGTVVLRGEFQGRAVAVKRLLKDFVTIATQEVALLQESDDHPHVIRYFCKEQRDTFLYIALELCPASLYDLIDQPASFPELVPNLDPKKALRQITSGLRHLHKLKIVHRDIKPQNILVSTSKHPGGGVRMLISDFGLCKKLDMDESSFQQTYNHAAGSFGYRAPEVLRGQVDPNTPSTHSIASGGAGSEGGGSSTGTAGETPTTTDPSMRLTTKIDIFSLGCIFYYVLTGGEHPFGGRYEREMNILKGTVSLERLDGLGDEAVEVQHLITSMVATDPRERPSAESVLLHPFFWTSQKRLLFLCDASDRFEIMERDPPASTLVLLETKSRDIVGDDWQKSIDRSLLENLGKYRKYDGSSVRDLLRVLRNKKHHYQDLPAAVRTNFGDLPKGFLSYFTSRFPLLLLHVYDTVDKDLRDEPMFKDTFTVGDEEII